MNTTSCGTHLDAGRDQVSNPLKSPHDGSAPRRSSRPPVAPADLRPSSRLRRAATAERQRIEGARARLIERQERVRGQLARLDAEIAGLDERDRLLAELSNATQHATALVGVDAASAAADKGGDRAAGSGGGQTRVGKVLRGRELREAAARILYRNHGVDREVHYRHWLDAVLQGGVEVVAKDPVAAFLTNVSRSPLIVRGDAPGTYRIDAAAAAALRRELAEAEAELAELVNVIAREPNPDESLREHRTRLLAAVRRLEGQVAEIDRVLAPPETDGSNGAGNPKP